MKVVKCPFECVAENRVGCVICKQTKVLWVLTFTQTVACCKEFNCRLCWRNYREKRGKREIEKHTHQIAIIGSSFFHCFCYCYCFCFGSWYCMCVSLVQRVLQQHQQQKKCTPSSIIIIIVKNITQYSNGFHFCVGVCNLFSFFLLSLSLNIKRNAECTIWVLINFLFATILIDCTISRY